MANIHMKQCPTSLIIGKCEFKPQGDSTMYSLEWLKLETDHTKCWRECRPAEVSYIAWRNVKAFNHLGNSLAVSQKVRPLYDPHILLLGV